MSCAKTDELIDMSFGIWTWVGAHIDTTWQM